MYPPDDTKLLKYFYSYNQKDDNILSLQTVIHRIIWTTKHFEVLQSSLAILGHSYHK